MDQQSTYNLTRHFKDILLIIAHFTFVASHAFISSSFASTDFNFLPAHQSTYSIEKFGTYIGNMHNELTHQGEQLSYISTTKAVGFAALFVKNDFIETSILNWPGNDSKKTPQQQSYHLFRGEKHKKNQNISFDWRDNKTLKLSGSYKNRKYNLSSTQPVWGRQLLPLLMSHKLLSENPNSTHTFYITDKGNLQKYTYTQEGTENIYLSGKMYPTLKFKIKKEASESWSYTWLSSKHYYLPLKIEQYKDGELNVNMQMTHFNQVALETTNANIQLEDDEYE